MFTIDIDGKEFTNELACVLAARRLMFTFCRSILIYKDGEPYRLLRY